MRKILISHRGNLNGRVVSLENNPQYIQMALDTGFECEVDIYYKSSGWWLGHDNPIYRVDINFLTKRGLWCHAKSIETFYWLLKHEFHCFWHQNDWVTLTNEGYIWTYPGCPLTDRSICVLPELDIGPGFDGCAGICSDYIENFKGV